MTFVKQQPIKTAHTIQSIPVRPYVQFDASNKDHMNAYHHFLKHNKWPNLEYRFYTNWPRISVPETCRRLVMNHTFQDEIYVIEGKF